MNEGKFQATVLYVKGPGNIVDISPLVISIQHSGDIMQASRTLSLRIINTLDGKKQHMQFEEGKEIRFLNKGTEQFRGIIFATDINAAGEMNITAFDGNIYLTKNTDTQVFRKKKASDIVRTICTKFGIEMGVIEDTGYVIPKQISRNMSLWDMMITALTTTRKQTGKKFVITNEVGKLCLRERKSRLCKIVFEDGVNLLDASYSRTIENMRNRIRVTANEDKNGNPAIDITEKNDASIQKYGMMQHLESLSGKVKQSQAKQTAKELLAQMNVIEDRAEIVTIGLDEVVAGSSVYVVQKMTGIRGGFYVLADTHTYENGVHTMTLQLSATDELPTLEYSEN